MICFFFKILLFFILERKFFTVPTCFELFESCLKIKPKHLLTISYRAPIEKLMNLDSNLREHKECKVVFVVFKLIKIKF